MRFEKKSAGAFLRGGMATMLAAAMAMGATAVRAQPTFLIGNVDQQLSNPFFAVLQGAVVDRARKIGLKVITGNADTPGDFASQLASLETMIDRGVKGIVLDPSNSYALVDIVKKARAAGIVVVTTNTTLSPADAADETYETNNLFGGELIGKWARAQVSQAGTKPKVALLDYDLSDTTAKARHDGFLKGFGIGDGSPQIVGTSLTRGNAATGQVSMENLLSAHPETNVVYAINEPAAQGAAIALKRAGAKPVFVTMDGGCAGVRAVANGTVGATVMQFPGQMGAMAVDAVVAAVTKGQKLSGIHDSGTVLITDTAVQGLDSKDSAWGLKHCWGP